MGAPTEIVRPGRVLDRAGDWLLDRDGDLYGDEQERLRWYEGVAISATVQGILLPWLSVVALVVLGRPAAPAIALILVGLFLPTVLVKRYVTRWRVHTVPGRRDGKWWTLTALAGVPYVVVGFQVLLAYGAPASSRAGYVVGAVLGGAIGTGRLAARRRREQARDACPDDLG